MNKLSAMMAIVLLTSIGSKVSQAENQVANTTKVDNATVTPVVNPSPWQATGLMVANGNTMEVASSADQKNHLVVLFGIAAPTRGQPYYKEARQALKDLVYGKSLTITSVKEGRNGFQVVKIVADGVDVNTEMVKQGWAWVHTFFNDDKELKALESAARQAKIGLWQDDKPVAPWEFRQLQRAARQQENQNGNKDAKNLARKPFTRQSAPVTQPAAVQ